MARRRVRRPLWRCAGGWVCRPQKSHFCLAIIEPFSFVFLASFEARPVHHTYAEGGVAVTLEPEAVQALEQPGQPLAVRVAEAIRVGAKRTAPIAAAPATASVRHLRMGRHQRHARADRANLQVRVVPLARPVHVTFHSCNETATSV